MYSWRGYQVAWMVGDENANGTFVPESTGAVDYGGYYASASFELSDGRRIVWAWVVEGRGPPYGGSDWAGVQALPREVVLITTSDAPTKTVLGFQPAKELEAWRSPTATYPPWKGVVVDNSTGNHPLPALSKSGMALEVELAMTVSTPPKVAGGVPYRPGIIVRAGGTGPTAEWTFVGLDITTTKTGELAAEVYVDRSHSSTARVAKNSMVIPNEAVTAGVPYKLRIYVDHSVLTVFAPSGKVLTTRVYPSETSVDVQLASVAAPTTFDVTAWGLAPPSSAAAVAAPATSDVAASALASASASALSCTKHGEFEGSEDVTLWKAGLAFVSSGLERSTPRLPIGKQGGKMLMVDLRSSGPMPVLHELNISGMPADLSFHPHGLHLDNATQRLFTVCHSKSEPLKGQRAAEESVVVFDVVQPALSSDCSGSAAGCGVPALRFAYVLKSPLFEYYNASYTWFLNDVTVIDGTNELYVTQLGYVVTLMTHPLWCCFWGSPRETLMVARHLPIWDESY